jgi:formylglycine-generating enzyme required for sulfatase activity
MPRPIKGTELRVFVASPSDVTPERDRLSRVIEELNAKGGAAHQANIRLVLNRWETDLVPDVGRPQQVVFDQLPPDEWDIFIGILWLRFGTESGATNPATGKPFQSGTEEEFQAAYRLRQSRGDGFPRVMFYRCTRPVDVSSPNFDFEQAGRVKKFFADFLPSGAHPGLVWTFNQTDDFEREVRKHLAIVVADYDKSTIAPAASAPVSPPTPYTQWNPAPYLNYLASICNLLPLALIDPKYASPTSEQTVTLSDVYTNLEVTSLIKIKDDEKQKREREQPGLGREDTRRMTVLEAVTDAKKPRLVLLGDPGSGKSTFVNYLTHCLAMNLIEPEKKWLERLPDWSLGEQLPVRIILREWVAWLASQKNRQANAQAMWDFIQHDLTTHGLEKSFEPLRDYLLNRGGLILLDGLDEVPDANARREFLKSVVEDFARAIGKCRIVVTCRPYAYVKREWQLQGFAQETLAPFSEEQIATFVRGWYNAAVHVMAMNQNDANAKAEALIGACKLQYLAALAQRPLLLTLMATLHTSRGKLPDDRADLYEDCVRLLLDYWQESKKIRVDGETKVERGIIDELGISRDRLERALNQVAYQAHSEQGKQQNRQNETADISGDELRRNLKPTLGDSWDNADKAIHYVRTRAGLLLEREPDRFAFPHRTFQEFLSARHLVSTQDYPFNLASWAKSDRAWWREVYLLAAGHQRANAFGQAVALINELCAKDYMPGQPIADADAYSAALAAQAAIEIKLSEHATEPGRYCDTYRKLQNWLVGIIAQGALPLKDRAEVGRILGALGDSREDVNCAIPAMVDVPAGEFIMGSTDKQVAELIKQYGKSLETYYKRELPQHRVMLKAYRIGKYPVTNAQFRRFVDDGGYTKEHRDCWTDAGWEKRTQGDWDKPDYLDHLDFGIANHPVVTVSWYESVAYCNWLNEMNPGRKFHLPTEAEWEKAARFTDAREYPWGDKFDEEKANTLESQIMQTTAVGLFPRGESVYHALDMSGNVWEWCSTKHGADYPYRADDGRENFQGNDARRLRGGAWFDDNDLTRCASRHSRDPDLRGSDFGFRVAESLPQGLDSVS